MASDPTGGTQRFFSIGTRIMGVLGLVLAVAFVVVAIADPDINPAPWGLALVVFLGVLVWVAMFRQVLELGPTTLTVHGMFQTVVLPLERVETVVVSQTTVVRADGQKYVSAAVGRSVRQIRREARGPVNSRLKRRLDGILPVQEAAPARSYEAIVEEKIIAARNAARSRVGVLETTTEVVKRPHWPEIAALAVSGVATVVLFLVG